MLGRSKIVRRLVIILMMCVGCITAANAQSSFTERLQKSKVGEGKVTVHESKAIDELVNGKTATADQAEEIHAYIRSIIAEKYGQAVADDTTILYGGSCKASNAPELFAKPDIDGGLIGGASLKCADFKGIIDAWKK